MGNPLDEHAKAIGQLCMEWARLEGDIKNLFMFTIGLSPIDSTAQVIINSLDLKISSLITAIRAGCVARNFHPGCRAALDEALNYIDNYLRPARNRMVHDIWSETDMTETAITYRATPKTRRSKPQGGFEWIEPGQAAFVTVASINAITLEALAYRDHIKTLAGYLQWQPDIPLPAPFVKCPERSLAPRAKENQHPGGRTGTKRQSPPKASSASRRRAATKDVST